MTYACSLCDLCMHINIYGCMDRNCIHASLYLYMHLHVTLLCLWFMQWAHRIAIWRRCIIPKLPHRDASLDLPNIIYMYVPPVRRMNTVTCAWIAQFPRKCLHEAYMFYKISLIHIHCIFPKWLHEYESRLPVNFKIIRTSLQVHVEYINYYQRKSYMYIAIVLL